MAQYVFSPEKEFGKGCDLAILHNCHVVLVEIKRCNLSIHDISRAIVQLSVTENRLRKQFMRCSFMKLFIHDKSSRCKVYGNAVIMIEKERIQFLSTGYSENARKLVNLYRKILRNKA